MHRNNFIASILSGVLLSVAFLMPASGLGAVSCFFSILFLCLVFRNAKKVYFYSYLSMLIANFSAFYWLPQTMERFGGFNKIVSIFIFCLYAIFFSLKHPFAFFVARQLKKQTKFCFGISLGIGFFVSEYLFFQLFPWSFVHPFICVRSFSILASFVGVEPLVILLFVFADTVLGLYSLVYSKLVNREFEKNSFSGFNLLLKLSIISIVLGFGYFEVQNLEQEISKQSKFKIALIQGNLSTFKKGNVEYLGANIATYRTLTNEAIREGANLVVWPESVLSEFIPNNLITLDGTNLDPILNNEVPIIVGGLSYERTNSFTDVKKYNSAILINREGLIKGIYNKKILMPFGEYLPFASIFPFIKQLSPQTGDFTPGESDKPFKLILKDNLSVNLSLQICYEDLLPSISRASVNNGGQLIVNIANDAWYGKSVAPYQHNLLAAWRAIETSRFFVRATNTGYSSIIDPFGRSFSDLELFKEGYIISEVSILNKDTLFVKTGNKPYFFMALLILFGSIILKFKKQGN